MKEVKVNVSKPYNIYISHDFNLFKGLLEKYKCHSLFIVTDDTVYNLYKNYFNQIPYIIGLKSIKPGEGSKNINTVLEIYNSLIKCNANKKTTIVAMGGGVVGDLAAFVASTFMRGIRVVHIPTTLMAQCDSSIGGKTGFDYNGIKNIIGTFYQPEFVFTDVNFLKTLDKRQFLNGIAEVIKYSIVFDDGLWDYLMQNKRGLLERESDKLMHIVHQCSKIKAKIVEEDVYDNDRRQVLNFGHTIGHAIESYFNFQILHGEAVSIGMVVESYLSYQLGYIDFLDYQRIVELIKDMGLPIKIKVDNVEKLMEYIKKDKKKINENIKFALPYNIGHAIITGDLKENFVKNAIKYCLGG